MNDLTEDYLLEIFKKLNFNERAKLRLVSKQFRRVVDLIQIQKLVLFHKSPPHSGEFRLIDEKWSLLDTVYVTDVDKFFQNQTILNSLQSIEKLALFGAANGQFCKVNVKFDQLKHLEIEYFDSQYSTILRSSKIETFFNASYFVDGQNHRLAKQSRYECTWPTGVFDLGSKLKVLHLVLAVDGEFVRYCVSRKLFEQLEELKINVIDSTVLQYLNDEVPSLKRLYIYFGYSIEDFRLITKNLNWNQLAKRLRKDLSIYVWGVLLKANALNTMNEFFERIQTYIESMKGRVAFRATSESLDILRQFQATKAELFTEFKRFFVYLIVEEPLTDLRLFKDVAYPMNIESVFYTFKRAKPTNFADYLTCIPNLKEMQLKLAYLCEDDDRNLLLDLLPVHCKRLHTLTIHCWSKVNFRFLNEMSNLKFVKLLTPDPFDQDHYVDLIRNRLKYLVLLETYFEKTKQLNRDQLTAFKQRVVRCIDEIKMTDAKFKIEIHRNNMNEIIRYFMVRKGFNYSDDEEANNDDLVEIHKMAAVFSMIKQMNNARV